MADEPTGEDLSKLELPSLRLPGLGRRGKRADRAAERRAEPSEEPREQPRPLPTQEPEEPVAPVEQVGTPQPVVVRGATAIAPETPQEQPESRPARTRTLPRPTVPRATVPRATVPRPRLPRPTISRPTMPALSGRVAAAVTGLLVGVVGAVFTYLSLRGCEAVKGTESCGGTGMPILVVILALMVLVGAAVLGAWGVEEARSTSFLGVGVLCVILLVALIEELFSGWMFVAVPVLAALSYVVAHWVTTAFVEPQPEPGPQHDVR
jgi:hypothetical protein